MYIFFIILLPLILMVMSHTRQNQNQQDRPVKEQENSSHPEGFCMPPPAFKLMASQLQMQGGIRLHK